MLEALPLSLINRLLTAEPWAADLLRPHAGQSALLQLGAASLCFTVTEQGALQAAKNRTDVDLILSIAASALPHLFEGPEALRQSAHIEGNARFAESIGLLLQHLRPDLAGHFAPLIGDIAAHRLARGADSLSRYALATGKNVSRSVKEALTAPGAQLVVRSELDELKLRLDGLLKRLHHLEKEQP